MTRYFIPKDIEPTGAPAGARRMTVYVYTGDEEPIPDYYDEVQLVPGGAEIMGEGDRQQIETYRRLVNHPFFDGAAAEPGALSDTLVRRLDAVTDAIVIRREELPEVDVWFPGTADENLRTEFTQVTPSSSGPDLIAHLEQEARERLAIATYLREHQQPDPEQVQLFSKALIEAGMDDVDGPTPTTVARRMAERYRIEVTP